MHDGGNTTARQLAKMLREILDAEEHALADVVDILKTRAGRCRIRWTPDDIAAALAMVGSNRGLLPESRPKSRPVLPALELVPGDTARAVLAELYRRNPNARKLGGL